MRVKALSLFVWRFLDALLVAQDAGYSTSMTTNSFGQFWDLELSLTEPLLVGMMVGLKLASLIYRWALKMAIVHHANLVHMVPVMRACAAAHTAVPAQRAASAAAGAMKRPDVAC